MGYSIRKAKLEERSAIQQLIADSARGLSRAEYTDAQIEAAIATVFGVDTSLIEDETYFVVEEAGQLIGCGGWSKRRTLYGGDQYAHRDVGYVDPNSEPARIRAFFVHPDHARKGVARAIIERCEDEARASGFRALELLSTMPGVKFYESCGYVSQGDFELELRDDIRLEFVPMRKEFRKGHE
jgi:GNAT superfamily N-acetyltransferase